MNLFSNETLSVSIYFHWEKLGLGFWAQSDYGGEINFLFFTLEIILESEQDEKLEKFLKSIEKGNKND